MVMVGPTIRVFGYGSWQVMAVVDKVKVYGVVVLPG